jgi:predicted ATPase
MELIGVQFSNLGLLERQFIPFHRPVTMLVGRNNAGKSALLSAVHALKGLAGGTMSAPILRYSAGDVGIEIFCRPEAQDRICPVTSTDWWNQFVERHSFEIVYQLRASRSFDKIGIDNAQLLLKDKGSIEFVKASNTGLTAQYYAAPTGPDELPTSVVQGSSLPAEMRTGPDQFHVTATANHPFLGGLTLLQSAFLVLPHRIVPPSLGLKTESVPLNDGGNLAQFLHTLQSNNRRQFLAIETFIAEVFPEFESLNVRNRDNQAHITLTIRNRNVEIPLNNCGTGVEQLLALATLIVTSASGTVFLIDEPHSFLHPFAERTFLRFLNLQADKKFLIATHSAVMMNEVPADCIVHIEPPGRDRQHLDEQETRARVLYDLGYQNSDVLFNDRLIIGEGKTEQTVLPILIGNLEQFAISDIEKTGFASLDGVPEKSKAQQTAVLRFEHLLTAVGREKQERVYVFDMDRSTEDQNLLRGTRPSGTQEPPRIAFLSRMELENYLLVPEAIAQAIGEESKLNDNQVKVTTEQVRQELQKVLDTENDPKLFPHGRGVTPEDVLARIKGSRALEMVYERLGAGNYHKEHSGRLIAKFVNLSNQPALAELLPLFRPIFPPARFVAGVGGR